MTDIVGFDAGKAELDRLLREARDAVQAAQAEGPDAVVAAVRAASEALVEFTNRTEPGDVFDSDEVEAIRRLDRLADEARREMNVAAMDMVISRIEDGSSRLNTLAKEVKRQALVNERTVRRNRLLPVREAVDSMTDLVEAVKQARDELDKDNPEEAVVASALGRLSKAYNDVKQALTRL